MDEAKVIVPLLLHTSTYSELFLLTFFLRPSFISDRCPVYGFSNDFKGHLMAVRACVDSVLWDSAVANPSSLFIQLTAYMKTNPERAFKKLMTEEKRTEMRASMQAAIKAGQEKHNEWTYAQLAQFIYIYSSSYLVNTHLLLFTPPSCSHLFLFTPISVHTYFCSGTRQLLSSLE